MTHKIPPVNRRLSVPHQSPAEDRLLAMVAALTSELSVTRERLDTLERLLEQKGVVEQAAIESFDPAPPASEARGQLRRRIISRVFRPLREDARRVENQA